MPCRLSHVAPATLCPWWPLSCQSLGEFSHWTGSEHCCSDSGSNTGLSSHCLIRPRWVHAAAYSNQEGKEWQLFHIFISFVISVSNKQLLCNGQHCCKTAAASQQSEGTPTFPEISSVIIFCTSVTPQRSNSRSQPNTSSKYFPGGKAEPQLWESENIVYEIRVLSLLELEF